MTTQEHTRALAYRAYLISTGSTDEEQEAEIARMEAGQPAAGLMDAAKEDEGED
jgi:hypothetical protein